MEGPNPKLTRKFLNVLQRADPNVMRQPSVTAEFAERLAAFSEAWASGAEDIHERAQFLTAWAEANGLAVPESMAAGDYEIMEAAPVQEERELAEYDAEG
jgi:hypothetical protein